MFGRISDRLLLLLLSALAALLALIPLERLGLFGSSFEGKAVMPLFILDFRF